MIQNQEELYTMLMEAKDAYYEGKPFMSDIDFDAMENTLRSMNPTHIYFTKVGSEASTVSDTVVHGIPMLSMSKLKFGDDIESWFISNNIPSDADILSEPKIDGIAGSIVYSGSGKLIYGSTRGDGKNGKLINFIGKKEIVNVPMQLDFRGDGEWCKKFEVRGEFYIPVKYGETIFKDMPLRNVAAGIIKSGENTEYLKFMPYQAIVDDKPFMDGENYGEEIFDFDMLERLLEFEVVDHLLIGKDDIEDVMRNYIEKGRDLFEYETDGMVFIVNDKKLQEKIDSRKKVSAYHHYNIAIKPPARTAETKLNTIEISIGKSGRIIPTGIVYPVVIANIEISRATLNNVAHMEEFGDVFYKNASVVIKRANDVIPKIVEISDDGDRTQPILIPTECPSCGTKLIREGRNLFCTNKLSCPGIAIARICHWIETMDIKDVGFKAIEAAYNLGIIRSIVDLYRPGLEEKLYLIDGFADGKVGIFMNAINLSKVNVSDVDIIKGIGLTGIGRRVLENYNLTSIDTLKDDLQHQQKYSVCRVLLEWLNEGDNYNLLKELKVIMGSKSSSVNKNGKIVVMTGTFDIGRKDLIKELESRGYTVSDSVTKSTTILLAGVDGESNTKFKKALEFGIRIETNLENFLKGDH